MDINNLLELLNDYILVVHTETEGVLELRGYDYNSIEVIYENNKRELLPNNKSFCNYFNVDKFKLLNKYE